MKLFKSFLIILLLLLLSAAAFADITLETGNGTSNPVNNAVHQNVCVTDHRATARHDKRCFSFAMIGSQWPQFAKTWLGWSSWVVGAILEGEVYETTPVSGATIVKTHSTTVAQDRRWTRYMTGTRLGLNDGYSVARHNCRMFSQNEFDDAPSNW